MKIGLFIPCYVDQLRPEVGMAVVRLFDTLGLEFDFPEEQTCCGQPFISAGEQGHGTRLGRRFALVASLHQDYERIDLAAISFGWFLCGPSKTADIEQALVLGAHGPRSMRLVWRCDDASAAAAQPM